MAKKGQEIEELYISLGLDVDSLKLGFDTAGKTVSQSISRINSENKKIQIKTEVDLARLQSAESELDKIRIRQEAITRQLELQRQKESILNAQMQRAVKDHGADSGITRRAQLNLLYQQKTVAGLENQLRTLGVEMDRLKPRSDRSFSAIHTGATRARSAIGSLGSSYGMLSAKMAAFLAVASTGAGLFNLTNAAMNAGQATYRLTQRLHVSTAEAGELKRVFTLAGSDINTITPFIARLDKQLLTAGESGNTTTKSLERFGVALADQQGGLLSVSDQLSQLAAAYNRAQEAGEEEAFTAEVLGAKGAALIPVLQDYNDLLGISKDIKTTGLLNPQEAHETWLEWQKMQMELGQLKTAMGAALLPISRDLMPDIVAGLQTMVQLIKDNKDGIVALGEAIISAMGVAKDIIGGVADALDAVGINAENVRNVLGNIKTMNQAGQGDTLFKSALTGALAGAAGASVIPGVGTVAGGLVGAGAGLFAGYKSLSATEAFQQQKAINEAEAQQKKQEKKKASSASQGTQDAALKEQQKVAAEAAKANEELKESLLSINRTGLDNSLHVIDEEMKKFRERGASEVEIARLAEAKKAKVIKDFNDEVAKSIDSIWKSEYQNRLDEIEKEKEAWRQKGLDEVKATRWAEEEKRQLQQETALHMFKENYKYLKIYRSEMAGFGSDEEKKQNAMQKIAAQMRKDAGITEDMWTTPGEIAGFQDIYKKAQSNMVPIYDVKPTNFIWKGTEAVPMFSPEYERSMSNLSQGISQTPAQMQEQNVNYNLNVNVTGLEDVGNQVAQTAARKIMERLPGSSQYNVSYGG